MFISVVSLIVGLAFAGLALWLRSQAHASQSWPSVDGVVLESRVDDKHLEFRKPVLRYRYSVSGRHYVGHRVAFSGHGGSRAAMTALIAPYAVGAQVRVHYDPAKPSRAVLNADGRSDWLYWFCTGLAFCALPVLL